MELTLPATDATVTGPFLSSRFSSVNQCKCQAHCLTRAAFLDGCISHHLRQSGIRREGGYTPGSCGGLFSSSRNVKTSSECLADEIVNFVCASSNTCSTNGEIKRVATVNHFGSSRRQEVLRPRRSPSSSRGRASFLITTFAYCEERSRFTA